MRGKGLKTKLMLPAEPAARLLEASRALRRVKPDVVLGMGGYITFPAGLMTAASAAVRSCCTNRIRSRVSRTRSSRISPNACSLRFRTRCRTAEWTGIRFVRNLRARCHPKHATPLAAEPSNVLVGRRQPRRRGGVE